MKSLLLIEDDPIMGESLVQRFELEGFEVNWCRRLSEATQALPAGFSAVISDVRLTDGWRPSGSPACPSQRALPWFFLTGYGSVNDAVATVRAGAREYLTKPFDIERLVTLVQEASSPAYRWRSTRAVLGISPAMRHAESLVRKVARQRVSVLLTGESGVGKEVAAQRIHQWGEGTRARASSSPSTARWCPRR